MQQKEREAAQLLAAGNGYEAWQAANDRLDMLQAKQYPALLRQLRDLETAGYVTTEPPNPPKGTSAHWTLHPEAINADLAALMARWTPHD